MRCCWRQDIFAALEDAGRLVEQEGQQLYSEAAGKFLADRFVSGTCPKCGYEVRAPALCPACPCNTASKKSMSPRDYSTRT
jgi:methionyl-tRNA synthetase